jgi:hypothetical protein
MCQTLADAGAGEAATYFLLPDAATSRSADDLAQWLSEVLRDEISTEGLGILGREGSFGPLRELFPEQAEPWAAVFRVAVDDCVAFRMERDGITAELVFGETASGWRILRCNNVKQMAPGFANPS